MTTAPTKNISLTVEEGKVLLQLIDLAVKAAGLNAAEAGVVLAKKINAAFEPAKSTASPETQA
jgi:hypothetical protein